MAIPEEMFFLDPDYHGTLQQELKQSITEAVIAGRFQPGERLPPSRRLARYLGISRITVTLAYADLVASGYLESRPRYGFFIAETAPVPPKFALEAARPGPRVDWSAALGRRFSTLSTLPRPADWRRYRYPFIYGQVDRSLFDHQNWRLCGLRALGQRDFDAVTVDQYDRDDPMLVEQVLRHILPRRGIAARPEEVLITLGAQNALWMCTQILLTRDRIAALEEPTYPGLRDILAHSQCRIASVPVDGDGLPPEAVPAGTDVVFATASHQCPTNVTMPLARRKTLLARAAEAGFLIVEDDYEAEISYSGAVSPALKSLDRTGSVIYVGSFSKTLFPGLRLGFLVGDAPFIREARALRALTLRHPPGHLQRSAAYFLSLGHYEAQLQRINREFRRRRAAIEAAIAETGLDRHGAIFGGSSVWLTVPPGIDPGATALALRDKSVLIEPGDVFFAEPQGRTVRLAFSSIETARIADGVRLVAEAMGTTQPKAPREKTLSPTHS